MREELTHIFSETYKRLLYETLQMPQLEEIRFRIGKPVLVSAGGREWFLRPDGLATKKRTEAVHAAKEELEEILGRSCRYSPYAYQRQISQGFLTLPGGHRLGMTGEVAAEQGKIRSLKYFNGMNLRLARQHPGLARPAVPYLYHDGRFQSTLCIAPPGAGKTSFLRDCIRWISDGTEAGKGCNVGVVDERSELAACAEGIPQNELGIRTDVLDGCPKGEGVLLLLRSMNPSVIVMDELGGEEDARALERIKGTGVSVLASLHGEGFSAQRAENFAPYFPFERFLTISKLGEGRRRYAIYDRASNLLGQYEM